MSWDLSSEEVICAKLESQQTVIFVFSRKIKELEKELEQQRFNNKHNLSIDQTVADKIEQLEKELELRSSWVKHHQACVEANSVREHKLEERLAHLEKVCENSMDSEHGYAEYRKVFKLGKG